MLVVYNIMSVQEVCMAMQYISHMSALYSYMFLPYTKHYLFCTIDIFFQLLLSYHVKLSTQLSLSVIVTKWQTAASISMHGSVCMGITNSLQVKWGPRSGPILPVRWGQEGLFTGKMGRSPILIWPHADYTGDIVCYL